jgi:copper chaperone CopZ
MKCKGCANAVHNALNSVEGVQQNSVSLDEHTAKIFTKGKKVSETDLDDVLRPLGFKAKKKKGDL